MSVPIVVDLDGTLLRTDLLLESFFSSLSSAPLRTLRALGGLAVGRAELKLRLADAAIVEVGTLPINGDVLRFLKAEHRKGRPIYIASACDRRYAEAIAAHVGLFEGAFGSDGAVNLSGESKARALCEAFGEGGFDYIGDAAVDEAVWRKARRVYIADARAKHLAEVRAWAPEAEAIGMRTVPWMGYVHALRAHQWLKNVLVFVPALAAHTLIADLFACLVAFISFNLCASSVYILNDLLDLRSDRAHPRKRHRPFAAGTVPIRHGAMLVPLLLVAAFALALLLPPAFLAVLAGYYLLTCLYSLVLKKHVIIDVIALACLYGARLLAGAAAASLPLSPWLIAFATFFFLCLALVKRCSELIGHQRRGDGDPRGRGYRLSDLPALQAMAAASGYLSTLVLALYLNSDAVRVLYAHPNRLWLICVIVLFWISRTLLLTHRGEIHDDPVIYAATDRVSQLSVVAAVVALVASI